MKNILVVLNGTFTPHHVVNAAINIASSTSSLLHAGSIFSFDDIHRMAVLFVKK